MLEYWPWYVGGSALAGVALVHWVLLARTLAVSGRVTGLVDRVRHGPTDAPEMTQDEMVAALHAATAEAFGEDAVTGAPPSGVASPAGRSAQSKRPQSPLTHLGFLLAVTLGGFLASLSAGDVAVVSGLRSELFTRTFGGGDILTPLVLLGGGMLVGFGTRMSGGCTSGHGLCGTSRMQPGSLLATMAFFGAGVATSMLMEVMW